MPDMDRVAEHYTHGGLLDAIRNGVAALGKTPKELTIDDLAPIDEFHIGGRIATADLLDQLNLSEGTRVLDIGCGLGGAARFAADRYGVTVAGLDLTAEFVETGRVLCGWLGMMFQVALHQGSALEMPFSDGEFDAGYMIHVGMNIDDKAALFAEAARVLKPGAGFAVYDVMRTGDGDLDFPVPWADDPADSAVAGPGDYVAALTDAGFVPEAMRDRGAFALEFFDSLQARVGEMLEPPPLGLHLLAGGTWPAKLHKMIGNISAGRIAPVEIIVRKNA